MSTCRHGIFLRLPLLRKIEAIPTALPANRSHTEILKTRMDLVLDLNPVSAQNQGRIRSNGESGIFPGCNALARELRHTDHSIPKWSFLVLHPFYTPNGALSNYVPLNNNGFQVKWCFTSRPWRVEVQFFGLEGRTHLHPVGCLGSILWYLLSLFSITSLVSTCTVFRWDLWDPPTLP